MNLGLCIGNLLRRYPTVEVPGIGVFKITHVPASYDHERSMLHPPTSHIELAEGSADFSPLLNYVRAQRGVDEPTAMHLLEQAVGEVRDAINRNGSALLDGLGYLMAEGASLVFQPFTTDGFGTRPVKVRPVEKKEAAPLVDEQPLADEVEAPDDVVQTLHPRRRYAAAWIVAATLVLLASAAGVAWYYKPGWFEGEKKTQLLGQNEKAGEPLDRNEPPGPVTSSADSTIDSAATAQLETTALDSLHADTAIAVLNPPKPAVTYEIIVGSFATMEQARKYVARMKAKGVELKALDSRMPGNRKKISWGSYATEEEAYRELARVQKNFEPGAWIAKVEHE